MKHLLVLILFFLSACTLESAQPSPDEWVDSVEQKYVRCLNYNGLPWTCVWDAATPGDYSDDIQGYDLGLKDNRTDCYRVELEFPPATPHCFLSKGWHPDTNSRRDKVLIREGDVGDARGWKNYLQADGPHICSVRKINSCTL